MSRSGLLIGAALAAVVWSSCEAGSNAEYGGEPERQLLEATVAGNVATVRQWLTSGANPNKLVLHGDIYDSPWQIALHQARRNRPALVEIVQAMLKSGANPEVAWRQYRSLRWFHPRKTIRDNPMSEAVINSVPDVARALMAAGLRPGLAADNLITAVETGQDEIVHILVEAGVDVNTHRANTPLVAAIEARNAALMTYLEAHGAREKP